MRIFNITKQQAANMHKELKIGLDVLNKTVAPIVNVNGFRWCNHMNYDEPPQKIYKYLSIEIAHKCIEEGNIRFSQPSMWNDGYEKRFYPSNCDYSNIITERNKNIFTPQLYACCFTQNMTSEAAWKIYSYNDTNACVQFSINVDKLRLKLDSYATNNNCMIYEGPMIYNYSDEEIATLHKKNANLHKILFYDFKLDNYLSLLRIKRNAFYYENEYRFFVVPQNQENVNGDYLYIPICWKDIVDEIKIESKNSKFIKDCFQNFLKSKGFDITLQEFDLYNMENNIVVEK